MQKSFKKLFLFFAVITMAVVCFAFGASAETEGYYTYEVENGKAVITDVDESIGWNVIIPNTLGGCPVSIIGDRAFSNCTIINRITIPDSVTSICEEAFENCFYLTDIIFGANIDTIGNNAFSHCQSFKNIYVNDFESWLRIDFDNYYSNPLCWGGNLYFNNKHITNLVIPKGITSINDYMFVGYENFETIEIPDSVTYIGANVFKNCSVFVVYCNKNSYAASYVLNNNLKYVYVDGVDAESIFSGEIGKYTWKIDKRTGVLKLTGSGDMIDFSSVNAPWYEYRDYIASLELPEGLSKIGNSAFKEMYRLKFITIPDSVTAIGNQAFEFCDNLNSVRLSSNLINIGYRAFYCCYSLEKITIPQGVEGVSTQAFYRCYSLKNLVVPSSIIYIGDAFLECDSFTNIIFELDEKNQSKIVSMPSIKDTMVKEIVLPASIKSIGYSVFPETIEKVTIYNPECNINASCGLGYTHTIIGFKGSTAEKFAEQIGAEFIDIETVHKHNYKTVETIKATCKSAGKTVSRCTCGKEKTTSISKLAHTLTTVKGKSATCTATGLTDGKKCSVCGTVTVAQKSIAKKAHSYTTTTTKATLTKNGKTVKKCSVCGYVSSTTTIYYPKTITLSATTYTYNGKVKAPAVTVKDSKGNVLKNDTDYTVKYESGRKLTGKYTVTVTFKGKYSGTKTLSFTITPMALSKVTATQTTTSVTLKWSKVTGATGYRVFQNVNGKWKTLANTTKLTYTIKKLKAGTAYTFAVRPYTVDGKDTILAAKFTQLKTATMCKTPTLKLTSTKKGVANASWTNVAGETGYELYGSSKKSSGFKKLATTKANVVKASKNKLTSKKTYYFKVRAYTKTDSGTVYSAWSAVKSVKIK